MAGRDKDKQLSTGARQPEGHWTASGCLPIFKTDLYLLGSIRSWSSIYLFCVFTCRLWTCSPKSPGESVGSLEWKPGGCEPSGVSAGTWHCLPLSCLRSLPTTRWLSRSKLLTDAETISRAYLLLKV